MTEPSLDFLFNPQTVAVVGATEDPHMIASSLMQHFIHYDFKGRVYPINPKRSSVCGFKAYPDIKSVPGSVDYIIYCISLSALPELMPDYREKGVRAIHLFSGRSAETGRPEAIELEKNIREAAMRCGIRLLGPNCMGIYNPRIGLSNGWDLPRESGKVAANLQSGGISQDLVRAGALRGMRFSKAVSYGNALDLNESDLLDYFAGDPETGVILCYLEGVKDGRRYLSSLRNAARKKPVVVLKGGRTGAGNLAAASHTASLAGAVDIWSAVIRQAGAIPARNFEDWVDLGVGFSLMPPVHGLRVGLTGGGGGHGVLNADECEEWGLKVIPLPRELREYLREKAPLIWDWVGNPVDVSIMRGTGISNSEILLAMAREPEFDLLISQITQDTPGDKDDYTSMVMREYHAYRQIFESNLKPIAVVLSDRSLGLDEMRHWRWQLFGRVRTDLVKAGIPVFPTVGRAARVVKELIDYYQKTPGDAQVQCPE